MHEHHIVEKMVRDALAKAADKHITAVRKVKVFLNETAGLEESSVRLYFEEIAVSTILESADLEIRTLPAQLLCKKCNIVFTRRKGQFNCPKCNELASLLPSESFSIEIE